jgi:hypothetical protein
MIKYNEYLFIFINYYKKLIEIGMLQMYEAILY